MIGTAAPARQPVRWRDWSMSPAGLWVSTRLEATRLLRSRAWLVAVAVWFVVVTGLTGLFLAATGVAAASAADPGSGLLVFGIVGYGVLALGAMVAPALTATSVNGDRRDGTLATWQTTLLTPAEIATGRLLVGWAGATALVVATLPALLLAAWASDGGVPAVRVVIVLALVLLSLMVVVSIGLALSARLSSPVASSVVTYLLVLALGVLGPILFGLSTAILVQEVEVTDRVAVSYDPVSGDPTRCRDVTTTRTLARTDLTWPLLISSPFVVIADATARGTASFEDVYGTISDGVRSARLGPQGIGFDQCDPTDLAQADAARGDALPAVWGWGLAWLLAIIAWCWWTTVRRLSLPVDRLPGGTRVA